MDASLMKMGDHFATYYVFPETDDHSSLDYSNKDYLNEWEDERELNGDIGLIPESSSFCESLNDMADLTDSPPSMLFQKMIDWSAFVYVDGVNDLPYDDDDDLQKSDITSPKIFDLPEYIDEPTKPQLQIKSSGKKIDKDGQKYIIENDEVDVETVVDPATLPVLEANDAFSLLEQFEASEKPITTKDEIFEKVPSSPVQIFEDEPKKSRILEALPQELIARIAESGKRKTITVIPPIPPTKKRSNNRLAEQKKVTKMAVVATNKEQIQFEHDYCVSSIYPKEPRKDSGFQSEEDDRAVLRNQPTVKTADGKLMVSLLKVNTIRNDCQKKKLNLEEYKKRRFIHSSNTTSLSSSPGSSTCSSPLPEDETQKRLKHQQKLMKMAAELLNTPAKNSKTEEIKNPVCYEKVIDVGPTMPPDLEVKTFVSIATNTDISSIDNNQELEAIKPLLKKVSDKINSNSFITSLIENIPKVTTKIGHVKSEEVIREDKIIHYLKKDREPVQMSTVAVQTDFDEEARYRRRIENRASSISSDDESIRSKKGSSRRRCRSHSSSSSSSSSSRSSRSPSTSPPLAKYRRQCNPERLREVEERRVVYVGRIAKGTTKEDLLRRFNPFGVITNVSLHFRNHGDNYGFVTFANKENAYEAVEHGNDRGYPKYDLSFGGRRIFCKTTYSDLDNMREDDYCYYPNRAQENSFDALLRAAQEKLRKRKP